MSNKRGAAVQINSDTYDPDAEGEPEPTGTWQKADEVSADASARNDTKLSHPTERSRRLRVCLCAFAFVCVGVRMCYF